MVFDIKKRVYKGISAFTLMCMVMQIVFPTLSYAQSGPSQEETGYTHLSAGENVDNFTGDFSYGIPLIDIDGHPLILSYNSNVSMMQEASWVGLGWTLNPGSIAREMRGIPDEFNGEDQLNRKMTRKPSVTVGRRNGTEVSVSLGANIPLTPASVSIGGNSSFLIGKYYNNYRGFGRTVDASLGLNIGGGMSGIPISGNINGGLGFSFDSQNGIGVNPSVGFGLQGSAMAVNLGYGGNWGASINTRSGLKSISHNRSTSEGVIGFSLSSSHTSVKSFGTQTYVPKVDFDLFGTSFIRRKGGGIYADVTIPGFVSASNTMNGVKENYSNEKSLVLNDQNIPIYGYNHLDLAENDESGIMDFNREKERVFSEDMESLPFSNITYDLYQVNTPGIGSIFRAYRNDVGSLRDPENSDLSLNSSLATSKSFGVFYKSVKSFGAGTNLTTSGEWNNVDAEDRFRFKNETLNTLGAEKFYFKTVGEKTPINEELYNNYGNNTPVKLGVFYNAANKYMNTTNHLIPDEGSTLIAPEDNVQTEREIRAKAINYYYNHELAFIGENEIRDYDAYVEGSSGAATYDVVDDSYRKEHHFGKMEVVSESGISYGYGLPAYNVSESEVSFNIEPSAGDVSTTDGMVRYDLTDNSLANTKGRDHYYSKTTTPSYAHSYLLTEIKSSDYVDKTGNGFSADDIGTYVKFNYSRIYGAESPFKWRLPVSPKAASESGYPKCNLNEGMQTDPLDDKGFYLYGEKEMWFPHSIETKDRIVEFYLADRKDAYPVMGENGELDISKPGKMLEKIVVYTREDRLKNGSNAVPLQTIEFDYDYSRCRNNPSNENTLAGNYAESGKLTLKSVHFYSGNSKISYQSPFTFTYEDENPDYNPLNIDRWANYKPNNPAWSNTFFPYAEQDEATANTNVKAWKLKRIVTPAGGGMEVEYEADRYTKIQDQDVMRHFRLIGMSDFGDLMSKIHLAPPDNYLSAFAASSDFRPADELKNPNNVIYFKLDEPITGLSRAEANEALKEKYFTYTEAGQPKVMDELYFRTKVKIKQTDLKNEFIQGFADIVPYINTSDDEYKNDKVVIDAVTGGGFVSQEGIGVVGGASGDYHYGYVILETPGVKDKLKGDDWKPKGYPVHPMQKNAWNFVRLNMPWHIYAECVDEDGNPSIDDCDYGIGADVKTVFNGSVNKMLNKNDFCRIFDPVQSTIRLMDPRKYKFGGNARVKSVTYFDNWDEISGEPESTYTLEYHYDQSSGLTSGVAAYEPITGGDENSFYQPKYFNIENKFMPDERHYQIDPIGESVFPAPTVGYGEVTIKFKDIPNLTRNSTGTSKYYFHTYADYPIKVRTTDLTPLQTGDFYESDINFNLFAVSQGFVVELNDMHGKVKRVKVVDAYGQDVSETKYEYFDFDERQKVVNRDGSIEERWLGKEFDVYVDKKTVLQKYFDRTKTKSLAIKLGIPTASESYSYLTLIKAFYAATFNKVINHTAVIKSVETTYLGRKSTAIVEAYDKYTGSPICQTIANEFTDNDYGLDYPSFWRYHELNPSYQNQRIALEDVSISASGEITGLTSVDQFFCRGDILLIENASGDGHIAYVNAIDPVLNKIELIDETGALHASETGVNILNLKSGFKNRLAEYMASYVLKSNPVGATNITVDLDQIITAAATEYVENKELVCEPGVVCSTHPNPNLACADPSVGALNPFLFGFIGNWKVYRSFLFQGERVNNDVASLTDIRTDGRIAEFKPFYAFAGGKWCAIDEADHPNYSAGSGYQNWRLLEEVTEFDRFGKAIESRNQLGIYSAVLYGYNNNLKMLPIATAKNAKVTQIAYDGFEDYRYLSGDVLCNTTGHFDFKDVVPLSAIVNNERHTGNFSLRTYPGQSFEVVRNTDQCGQGSDCDCEPRFAPSEGKYVIGAWVKEANGARKISYDDAKVTVEIITGGGTSAVAPVSFSPEGNIVEGWQRLEGVFEIPSLPGTDYCIKVKLENEGQNVIYFDDLRIHPFVAAMSTVAYDTEHLLPMANLDAYNYATYLMYDENFSQVRVRQETERGIYTVSEMNGGTKK